MVQLGGKVDLAQKSVGPKGGSQLGSEDFDCDGTVVFHVVREEDVCHPPAAEFALDDVAISERVVHGGLKVAHTEQDGEAVGVLLVREENDVSSAHRMNAKHAVSLAEFRATLASYSLY